MRNASPFRRTITPEALNALSRGTAMEPLGIVYTDNGPDEQRDTLRVHASTSTTNGR
jgi:hypothetical protein